jgi:acyl carrier protein
MERQEEIIAILADAVSADPKDIPTDALLTEIPGWSSLAHLMVLSSLLDELGIDIPMERALEMTTVADFLTFEPER